MPISKKDRIAREHKKADKEGTRAPVKANGLPVKPPAPKSKCEFCKMELVNTNKAQLISHAAKHEDKGWTKEKCWPTDFTA